MNSYFAVLGQSSSLIQAPSLEAFKAELEQRRGSEWVQKAQIKEIPRNTPGIQAVWEEAPQGFVVENAHLMKR